MKINKKDQINLLAINYFNATVQNQINDKNRLYKELLFLIYAEFDKIIYRNKGKHYGDDLKELEIIEEAIDYSIETYDPHRGKTFTSYLYSIKNYKKRGKEKKERKLEPFNFDEDWEKLNEDNISETTVEILEKKYSKEMIRSRLPSVVLNFYIHNTGKSASEIRLSYFRIFVTENIMEFIIGSSDTDYFNKTEAYDCTDKEFVRYITVLKYLSFNELKKLITPGIIKKISDIFPDEKMDYDIPIKIPCENRIIAEYRYRTERDTIRTSDSNISQQRKHYRNALAIIFDDLR